MKYAPPVVLLSTLILGACGSGTLKCDKASAYQQAVPGKRIEMLDGMDPLPPEQEMSIPKASPEAPPPPGECLDAPPTLRTGDDEG